MIEKTNSKKMKINCAKVLMNMNIYTDFKGYTYYNEMLFYFYRNYMIIHKEIYLPAEGKKDVHEETMRIILEEEKIVLKKLRAIKKKHQQKETNVEKKKGQQSNPLVKVLYVNMCLRSWLNFSIQQAEREAKNEALGIKDNEEMYFTSTESEDEGGAANNGEEKGAKRKKDYIAPRNHDHYYGTKQQNVGRLDYLDMPDTKVYRRSIDQSNALHFNNQKTLNSNNRNSLMIPGFESNYTNQDHSPTKNQRKSSNNLLASQEKSPANSQDKGRNKSNTRNPSQFTQFDQEGNSPSSSNPGRSPSNQQAQKSHFKPPQQQNGGLESSQHFVTRTDSNSNNTPRHNKNH